ncbi:uncharacterized protein LOC120217004 [Hibiscus syriacus]|uniref:uncharacterized protein LOC120217004 n=1 Tax=Hibiscus syriacus TaxID=106335 RepID=UPI0019206B17|nr:uncharacterized protein LOC120217004 [Hibiscus syriacus]
MFLRQKAKLHWLKEGDKCTKFFHSIIVTKNKRQTIRVLVNNRGERLESFDEMSSEILEYFKTLLGTKDSNVKEYPPTLLKDLMQPIPSFEDSEILSRKLLVMRSKMLFSVKVKQGPRSRRIYSSLFKKVWPLVGNDVIKAIKSIVDNTLLAQEIVKGYGRKIISPRCALKIDLQKAFDSINWDFIQAILKGLDLPPLVIEWIVSCYTDARYSISLNGSLVGYFKGAKGITQGDPLSPTLFVMVMNVLSNILNTAAIKGIFAFHPKCKKIELTHLSFTDDLLIFCKGNFHSVMGVITILDCFYEYSGLKLNVSKCEIFTAGISTHNLDSIINYSGFKHGRLLVRYLGVPLVTRKLTDKDYKALLDNIKNRLHQWSMKKMSYAACIQSIIKKIEQLCSRFFWIGSDNPATGVRVSWGNICQPKSEGGLGLKDLKTWNKACLIHLTRKLLAGEGSLSVAWIHNYIIKQQDFWTMDEYRVLAGASGECRKSEL